jgi:hypothetical protein
MIGQCDDMAVSHDMVVSDDMALPDDVTVSDDMVVFDDMTVLRFDTDTFLAVERNFLHFYVRTVARTYSLCLVFCWATLFHSYVLFV